MSGPLPGDTVAVGQGGRNGNGKRSSSLSPPGPPVPPMPTVLPSLTSTAPMYHETAAAAAASAASRPSAADAATTLSSSFSSVPSGPPASLSPPSSAFSSTASLSSSEPSSARVSPSSSSSTSSSFPAPSSSSSTRTNAPPAASSPAPSPAAAGITDPRLLTSFERWTLHASDSQFNALSGAIGGFTAGIVTCPLDVIKTKLQAQGGFAALQQAGMAGSQSHHRLYEGLVGTARVIWRDEGIRGLYRGLGPIIMGYLPTWAVWFTVYNKSKLYMAERYQNTFVINFWSSIIAGASSTVVTNPIWVIKTRLMSQMPTAHDRPGFSHYPKGASTPTSRPTLHTPWHYRSTLDAARKMYTTEGVLSFYSGLTPALLGLTHVAVQFPAYEYLKTKFTGRGMGDSPDEGGDAPAHWFGVLSATILSKILASSLTYPHEVIRTRLQTQRRPSSLPASANGNGNGNGSGSGHSQQKHPSSPQQQQQGPRYRGVIMTFQRILREEGWRAFYAGLGTNMMRAVPAATVTMLTYEYVMRTLKQTRHDAQHRLAEAAA